ncbi:MAG: NRDE family protein, partial [Gammaproteobacteria bacterium]
MPSLPFSPRPPSRAQRPLRFIHGLIPVCLAAFSLRASAEYPLVFAANRDELHERPAAPAGWWDDHGT